MTWFCTSVYEPNTRHLKLGFWTEIRSFQSTSGVPWVIYGDFNSIFAPSDKLNGNYNREDIRLVQDFLRDLHLLEPPSFGKRFTWTNGQANPIWVMLDHFLVISNWMAHFPKVFQHCLPRLGSDHVPIRLKSDIHNSVDRPFRLEQSGA